jgi:enoyl-CoA hydratase/carnithine racemase
VPVVDPDPGLIAAGPEALDALLADHLGGPLLVRFPADALARADPRRLRPWLRATPVATLGIGTPPPDHRDALDCWVDDPGTADRLTAGFARAPLAAWTAALLVRAAPAGVWSGLVAESTAYSMLQGGPEFAAWRTGHAGTPTEDDAPRVRVTEEHGHTVVTLTRPGRHNAVDTRMRDELDAALAALDPGRGPVILRGDGPSWCSGGDLDEFATFPDPVAAHVVRLTRSLALRFHALERRLVVALHGACLGAGIELAAFAARVVAADDARIGLPELGLGLVPGAGGTVSIPRRSGRSVLLRLLWGGEPVDAHRARRWGLVDEVVPPTRLADRAHEVAAELAAELASGRR